MFRPGRVFYDRPIHQRDMGRQHEEMINSCICVVGVREVCVVLCTWIHLSPHVYHPLVKNLSCYIEALVGRIQFLPGGRDLSSPA